jgi:cystathionine beta-lyase
MDGMVRAAIDLRVPGLEALHARRSEKWAGHPPDVLVSTIAEMDFALAPTVSEVVKAAVARDDLGYSSPEAPRTLRQAFVGFAERRLDWTVDPEQVRLVPDVMAGLVELCRILVEPGGVVAFATPAYPPFFAELPQAGVRLRELELREDGRLDLNVLEAVLGEGVRVLVLVNPHNPTGRAVARTELEQIAELCAAYDAWVLADEIHAPLVLHGARHIPWLEVSDAARARGVALTSASKAFNIAGLKAALAVTAAPPARDALRRLPPLGERAGLLGVLAAEAAFLEGDEWLDAVLALLGSNRDLLADNLAIQLPDLAWRPPQGTYLAWLDCRRLDLGPEPAAIFLDRGRVALSRGLDYGQPGAGFVRLNFATSPELVIETVSRMAAAL